MVAMPDLAHYLDRPDLAGNARDMITNGWGNMSHQVGAFYPPEMMAPRQPTQPGAPSSGQGVGGLIGAMLMGGRNPNIAALIQALVSRSIGGIGSLQPRPRLPSTTGGGAAYADGTPLLRDPWAAQHNQGIGIGGTPMPPRGGGLAFGATPSPGMAYGGSGPTLPPAQRWNTAPQPYIPPMPLPTPSGGGRPMPYTGARPPMPSRPPPMMGEPRMQQPPAAPFAMQQPGSSPPMTGGAAGLDWYALQAGN